MKFEKLLVVDIDGVVLDHTTGMYHWARTMGIDVGCEPSACNCYSMNPMFPGLSTEAIMKLMVEYSLHDDFSAIPVIDGFEQAILSLRADHGDMKLIAITAPGASKRTQLLRRENLRRFEFDEIHVLPMGASKRSHLEELPKSAIFFDDLAGHALTASEVGLTSVLFRQPHNVLDTHTLVADDWETGFLMVKTKFEGFPLLGTE